MLSLNTEPCIFSATFISLDLATFFLRLDVVHLILCSLVLTFQLSEVSGMEFDLYCHLVIIIVYGGARTLYTFFRKIW